MANVITDDAATILAKYARDLEAAAGTDAATYAFAMRLAAVELPDLATLIAETKASDGITVIDADDAYLATCIMGGLVLPILARAADLAEEYAGIVRGDAMVVVH